MKLETLETRALLAGLVDHGDCDDDNMDQQLIASTEADAEEAFIEEVGNWVNNNKKEIAFTALGAVCAPATITAGCILTGMVIGGAVGREVGGGVAESFCGTEMSEYIYGEDSIEACQESLIDLGSGIGQSAGQIVGTLVGFCGSFVLPFKYVGYGAEDGPALLKHQALGRVLKYEAPVGAAVGIGLAHVINIVD